MGKAAPPCLLALRVRGRVQQGQHFHQGQRIQQGQHRHNKEGRHAYGHVRSWEPSRELSARAIQCRYESRLVTRTGECAQQDKLLPSRRSPLHQEAEPSCGPVARGDSAAFPSPRMTRAPSRDRQENEQANGEGKESPDDGSLAEREHGRAAFECPAIAWHWSEGQMEPRAKNAPSGNASDPALHGNHEIGVRVPDWGGCLLACLIRSSARRLMRTARA